MNGAGKALKLTLAPGNRHDVLFAIEVLGGVAGKSYSAIGAMTATLCTDMYEMREASR